MAKCEECNKIDLLVHCDCNKDLCEECFEKRHFRMHTGVKIINNKPLMFSHAGYYTDITLKKLR